MKVFVSWSGGKDSSLALHRALEMGLEVGCLFSMLDEDGLRSRSHYIERSILKSQALTLGAFGILALIGATTIIPPTINQKNTCA